MLRRLNLVPFSFFSSASSSSAALNSVTNANNRKRATVIKGVDERTDESEIIQIYGAEYVLLFVYFKLFLIENSTNKRDVKKQERLICSFPSAPDSSASRWWARQVRESVIGAGAGGGGISWRPARMRQSSQTVAASGWWTEEEALPAPIPTRSFSYAATSQSYS